MWIPIFPTPLLNEAVVRPHLKRSGEAPRATPVFSLMEMASHWWVLSRGETRSDLSVETDFGCCFWIDCSRNSRDKNMGSSETLLQRSCKRWWWLGPGRSRDMVTCLDSGHILKVVEPKVYPNGLDVEYKRNQAVITIIRFFGLSNWMDGVIIHWSRREC